MINTTEWALPDAMARSTNDACDGNLRIPLSNRDAVVTGTDNGSGKIDAGASLNVDAISVGTVPWGRNIDSGTFEILAFYKSYVKELAIQWSYAFKNCPVCSYKLQILKEERKKCFPLASST